MWNNDRHDERYCLRFVFLILLFVVLPNANQLSAQQTRSNEQTLLTDERFAPGEVLSAGNNSLPVGTLKAKTYRLEKVKLLKPFESLESNGSRRLLESAYRVKIILDTSPDNDYFIWIDDIPIRAYTSGYLALTGENSISVLLYGPTLPFDDGASLAISTYSRKYELTTLPEKLTVPIKFQTKHENESRAHIERIHSSLIVSGKKSRRVVWITVKSPIPFPTMNSSPRLEIWDKVFVGGANGTEVSFMIGADEFAALKDGAQVILKGFISETLGRLNKNMLDK